MKKGLYALSFGTFGLGIAEYIMMSILPDVAADFGVDVCLASDAHDKADVGAGLADVARYARSFGFRFDTLPLRPDDIATRPAVLAQALDYLDGPLPRLRFAL